LGFDPCLWWTRTWRNLFRSWGGITDYVSIPVFGELAPIRGAGMDRSRLFFPGDAQGAEDRRAAEVLELYLAGIACEGRRGINTRTYIDRSMATKTISITEEAYERLKDLKGSETMSFSEVILSYYPRRRKLSETLAEIARLQTEDLADQIERT